MADELSGFLESSLNVTFDPFGTAKQHPRFSQFKQKSHRASQEERRRLTLETQKQRRYDFQKHVRKLVENDFEPSTDDESAKEEEEMEWRPPTLKFPRAYRNQIMFSEWLVDIPIDFETHWFIVPCPVGKRCLIVANKGKTKVYAKSGVFISQFPSLLPGGHWASATECSSGGTILDCLWNEHLQQYFVLDVQCWNGFPLLGCETEFRFCWLQSKFSEEPGLGKKSKYNKYIFTGLPFVPCDPKSISDLLIETAASPAGQQLDGLLFYHKEGHYTPGTTPLVGWLKPFMIPEILSIPVPENFKERKPPNYVSLQQHLNRKGKLKPASGSAMEVAENQ